MSDREDESHSDPASNVVTTPRQIISECYKTFTEPSLSPSNCSPMRSEQRREDNLLGRGLHLLRSFLLTLSGKTSSHKGAAIFSGDRFCLQLNSCHPATKKMEENLFLVAHPQPCYNKENPIDFYYGYNYKYMMLKMIQMY